MENRCVCCGSVIPEGRQVCKKCEVKAGMNREGYKDPTAEQALWESGRKREYGLWKRSMAYIEEIRSLYRK